MNIKRLPFLKPNTIELYLKAAASFAIEALLPDPRYRYNILGLRIGESKFPELHNWLAFLKKWDGPTNKAFSLDLKILAALQTLSFTTPFLSPSACAIDAIVLGAFTGSRCSEYCKGTTRTGELYAKVPISRFTREWSGFPIALVNKDITFYDASLCLVDFRSAPYRATYVAVRFRFDKGGGQNFSSRKFKKMPSDTFLCPVLTAHRILVRWSHLGADEMFPICCHSGSSGIKVLSDKTVTDTIRLAVKKAYPDPNHMFRREISLFRTHSIRVFACCTLIAADLSNEQIEYKLRWCSSAWKGYIRESMREVDITSLKLFRDSLADEDIISTQPLIQSIRPAYILAAN